MLVDFITQNPQLKTDNTSSTCVIMAASTKKMAGVSDDSSSSDDEELRRCKEAVWETQPNKTKGECCLLCLKCGPKSRLNCSNFNCPEKMPQISVCRMLIVSNSYIIRQKLHEKCTVYF